jgi:NADPH2:quinone reductase
MRAITMSAFGGPDVLQLSEVDDPTPTGAEVLVNVTRAGVNYADTHVRDNSYLAEVPLPYIPGNEVVGVTEDGRRVVGLTRGGGYAEKAVVRRRQLWEIPDGVSDDQAVPIALQGNSAYHLLFTVAQIEKGETVVIPAAAGGVGSIAVQLAREAGAKVIALASTEAKRQLALDLGATAAIDSSTTEGLAERIKEVARGGAKVALEMTGGDTFNETLASLAPRGRLAAYGYASGELATVPVHTLLENSLTVSGFWLPHLYTDRSVDLSYSTTALFNMVSNGTLRLVHGGTFPLAEAAAAHRSLASRESTGKVCLDTTL